MTQNNLRPANDRYLSITVGFLACAMLLFEILLTRITALRLFFHFAFVVISNCLLALGASGSVVYVFQSRLEKRARHYIWLFTLLFVVSAVATYFFLISFDIPHDIKLVMGPDMGRFVAFNLIAAVPLFFGGLAISLILLAARQRVNLVYGIDLLGAGLACLLCPLALAYAGAGGAMVFSCVLALVAAAAATPPESRRATLPLTLVALAAGLAMLPFMDRLVPVPGKQRLNFTAKMASDIPRPEFTQWTATSRIDLTPWTGDPFIYMRGKKAVDMPLPEQKYISQDGSAGTFVLNFSDHPDLLEVLRKSTYSSAYMLKDKPEVFIIGVGGGLDAWAAILNGASRVRAVDLNEPIIRIHKEIARDFSRTLIEDPRVELVAGEGRSALMRDSHQYDVIQMSGIDTWTALSSGAYILAENYLYTREAVATMYSKLRDGGLIQITRIAQAMEAMRLASIVAAALEQFGVTDITKSIVMLRSSDDLLATIVKKGEFTEEEISKLQAFCEDAGVEPIYIPNRPKLSEGPAGDYILTADKKQFQRNFERDISATTDDRPYFFNFTKWTNLLKAKEYLHDPLVVSQGNPLFVLSQLAVSVLLSILLILGPLAVSKSHVATPRDHAWRFLPYFAALGAGFIVIEIAVMQKFVLFLGHPFYSLTVTLFAMLVFTGMGSLLSQSWFGWLKRAPLSVPLLITIATALVIFVSPYLASHLIGLPLAGRILIVGALLALLSLPLGVPFAFGVRLLNHYNPSLVPWAWAVNGCLSVIGSVLSVVISMNFGFTAVLILGAAIYWIGFLSVRQLARTCPAEG